MIDNIVYRLEPEMSCDFADDQEWAPDRDDPRGRVAVRPVRAVFDAGAQGCFILCTPHYGAVPELVAAWEEAGVTGFRTAPMHCEPSDDAREDDPGYVPPAYVEVIVTGGPDDDLRHLDSERQVRASRKAAAIHSRFDPGIGGLFVGTADDIYGTALSQQTKEEARRF